jgi:hypothetical protein
MRNGYFWCKAPDGTTFVALSEGGNWWIPGLENPAEINPMDVLAAVPPPEILPAAPVIAASAVLVEHKHLH